MPRTRVLPNDATFFRLLTHHFRIPMTVASTPKTPNSTWTQFMQIRWERQRTWQSAKCVCWQPVRNWTQLNRTEPNWTDLRTSPCHQNSYSTDTSSLGTFNKASRIEIRSISINALKICHPHGATHMGYVGFENGWVDFWGVEFMDYNVCFDMLDDSAGGRVEFSTTGACEKHQQNFH